jgi:hypothetical protein
VATLYGKPLPLKSFCQGFPEKLSPFEEEEGKFSCQDCENLMGEIFDKISEEEKNICDLERVIKRLLSLGPILQWLEQDMPEYPIHENRPDYSKLQLAYNTISIKLRDSIAQIISEKMQEDCGCKNKEE